MSGNVSFYNETSGRAIYPTPTIAVVGVLDDWRRHATAHFAAAGLAIVLLGESRAELGGSEWLALRRGLERGAPPEVDLEHEKRLRRAAGRGRRGGRDRARAHDVADGGLAVALAECCFAGPAQVGARVELADSLRPDALLFGESTGRVIAATRRRAEPLLALARAARRARARGSARRAATGCAIGAARRASRGSTSRSTRCTRSGRARSRAGCEEG